MSLTDQLIAAVRGIYPDMPDLVRDTLVVQFHSLIDAEIFAAASRLVETTYDPILADHRALVRKLDLALNGAAGAAEQASLSDIVAQVERQQNALQVVNFDDGMVFNFRTPTGQRATMYASRLLDCAESTNGRIAIEAEVIANIREAIKAYPSAGPRAAVAE